MIALPTPEYRERVLEWAKQLADEGLTAPGFPEEFGGHGDPGANVAAFETLALRRPVAADQVRGPVRPVGRRRPSARHATATTSATCKQIASLELPGCFAMTEAGHGSDVQHLRRPPPTTPRRRSS